MENLDTQFRDLFNQFAPLLLSSGAALADPQVAAYHAAYARNFYTALMVNGFTPDEALSLVRAYGLSGAGSARSN